jgi:hypothetical protein
MLAVLLYKTAKRLAKGYALSKSYATPLNGGHPRNAPSYNRPERYLSPTQQRGQYVSVKTGYGSKGIGDRSNEHNIIAFLAGLRYNPTTSMTFTF